MTNRLVLLMAVLVGCNNGSSSCPPDVSSVSEVIVPSASVDIAIASRKPTSMTDAGNVGEADPNAPRFVPKDIRTTCPTCYGFGAVVLAITPSRVSAEQHALALRSLLAHYQGTEWNRHVTVVPWFGDKFALVFAETYSKQATEMCSWLYRLGWRENGHGLPGRRACRVYAKWPPERP